MIVRLLQLLIGACLVLALCSCAVTQYANGSSADIAALSNVVGAFKTAIEKKDKPLFMSLFHSDNPERITWQAVVDDAALADIQKSRPQAIKARYRPDNSFVSFIDGIVNDKDALEEQLSDVKIDSDGEVASVSFDYVYLKSKVMSNYGREKWLLVRTEQGWKITAVVYTIRFPKKAS
jgi:hypothetical protein